MEHYDNGKLETSSYAKKVGRAIKWYFHPQKNRQKKTDLVIKCSSKPWMHCRSIKIKSTLHNYPNYRHGAKMQVTKNTIVLYRITKTFPMPTAET